MFMPSVRRSAFFFALNFGPQIGLIRLINTDFFSSSQDDKRKISVNHSNQFNLWSISLTQ